MDFGEARQTHAVSTQNYICTYIGTYARFNIKSSSLEVDPRIRWASFAGDKRWTIGYVRDFWLVTNVAESGFRSVLSRKDPIETAVSLGRSSVLTFRKRNCDVFDLGCGYLVIGIRFRHLPHRPTRFAKLPKHDNL